MEEEKLVSRLKADKSFILKGLLDYSTVLAADSADMESWRKRLGARLLIERAQKKDWNRAEAARRARIDAGTVRRIERGENYEVIKLELYARALGRPVEAWLRETLAIPGGRNTEPEVSAQPAKFRQDEWDGTDRRRSGNDSSV